MKNKMIMMVAILAVVFSLSGCGSSGNNDVSVNQQEQESKDEISNDKEAAPTDVYPKTDEVEQGNTSGSVQEGTIGEFYPTEHIDIGDWDVQVILGYALESALGDTEVNIVAIVTNTSGEIQSFDSSSIFNLENNGLVDEAYSDYDYQKITDGTTIVTLLTFTFPVNANREVDMMALYANDVRINMSPLPMSEEDYDSFCGTYENEGRSGLKDVYMEVTTQEDAYIGFHYNPLTGVSWEQFTMDDAHIFLFQNSYYIWMPEEHSIFRLHDGKPDREDTRMQKINPSNDGSYMIEETVNIYDSDGNIDDEWYIEKNKFICTMDDEVLETYYMEEVGLLGFVVNGITYSIVAEPSRDNSGGIRYMCQDENGNMAYFTYYAKGGLMQTYYENIGVQKEYELNIE